MKPYKWLRRFYTGCIARINFCFYGFAIALKRTTEDLTKVRESVILSINNHLINMMNENGDMSPQPLSQYLSKFMVYLAENQANGSEALPSLTDMSAELGVSVSTLREELQVARALGLVEVRPRTGIKCQPYRFKPAILKSLAYAVSVDGEMFRQYSELRNHIEASYWYQAVSGLTPDDIAELQEVVRRGIQKLQSEPINIPHLEHRQLHLIIYRRLDNPFVHGILETYWDIYEAIGLSVYEDRAYLDRVWSYHQQMVEAIARQDFLSGYQALIAHMDLLFQREKQNISNPFE
jgi:DNA-binding FadR family transcriptional regulator